MCLLCDCLMPWLFRVFVIICWLFCRWFAWLLGLFAGRCWHLFDAWWLPFCELGFCLVLNLGGCGCGGCCFGGWGCFARVLL